MKPIGAMTGKKLRLLQRIADADGELLMHEVLGTTPNKNTETYWALYQLCRDGYVEVKNLPGLQISGYPMASLEVTEAGYAGLLYAIRSTPAGAPGASARRASEDCRTSSKSKVSAAL